MNAWGSVLVEDVDGVLGLGEGRLEERVVGRTRHGRVVASPGIGASELIEMKILFWSRRLRARSGVADVIRVDAETGTRAGTGTGAGAEAREDDEGGMVARR